MNNIKFTNATGKSFFQKNFRIAPLCFMTWMTLGYIIPVQAAVVVDPTQGQRPRVMANANGSLTVNINAASAGGISHNKFTQFDVASQGLVLNNSDKRSDTSVAGNIAGNKNMANGAAGVIINEVTSNRVSQLNGKIEVAGTKADVIIANPAGVTCDGCGFINTGRSTLTTGTPQTDNGTLTGIKVSDGVITVTGQGMDDKSDYTALLARTVKINARLDAAHDLQIMAGQYDNVTVANNRLTSTGAEGARAEVTGIDVSQFGGMYANKITLLVGQEGVGVSNSGLISADTDLTITGNGLIRNAGMIEAFGDTDINTSDAFNNALGTLQSSGDIYINSLTTSNDSGLISSDNINIVSGSVSNNNSDTYTPSHSVPRSLKDGASGGMKTKSDLIISSSNDIQGLKGVFSSDNGTVSLSADNMVNLPLANISAKDVNIFSKVLSTGEAWQASGNPGFELKNSATINATNDITIVSSDHYDNAGFLTAGNNLSLKSGGYIDNRNILSAKKNVDIESGSTMTNRNTIFSGADTTLKALTVINAASGKILSGGGITVVTNKFEHTDGFTSSTPIVKPFTE